MKYLEDLKLQMTDGAFFRYLQHIELRGNKTDYGFEISIYVVNMTYQCNSYYRAESRNVGIPADQAKPNTAKKFGVSVQDR